MSQKWKFAEKIINFTESFQKRNFSSVKSKSNSEYCLDLVRKWDYEGFICSLLIPDTSQRTTALALRAFNVEVALVAQRVSNAVIGQGRLQFWNDALEHIKKNSPPKHPVAQELARACQRHNLQRKFLQRLVVCRQTQLASPGFSTLKDLEKYAEESMSPILYLLVQSAGCADMKVDHAASHLGKALGISNSLRSLARARSPAELNLPQDLQLQYSISQESLLRGSSNVPGLKDAIFDMAACAKQHLDKARSLSGDVPPNVRVMMLPALPIARYLELLRLADFDPFDPRLQKRSPTLPLLMWWNRLRKKY